MKPQLFLLIFILLLSPPPAAATLGDVVNATEETIEIVGWVTDLLSTKCWAGDWGVADQPGTPVKNVKTDEHIRAWIDIIGFRDESIINDTHYVNGSAKDFAIVKRDAWNTLGSGTVVSFSSTYSISDSVYNTTTATQTTTLHWKYWVSTLIGGYWVHVHEGPMTVSCTVESPKHLSSRIPNTTVDATFHNRSMNPVTYLRIPEVENVMITRVSYKGSEIERYSQVGWVVLNDRGTEMVEFIDERLPVWRKDENQVEIDHQSSFVTIFDPDFNISKLSIEMIAPYESKSVTNFTSTEVSGNAKVDVVLLKVIAFLIGFSIFILFMIGVIKRRL